MTGQSDNIHWTEDSELLTAYVLDRIDAGERISLNRHLETCVECRHAVESELRLAAGVKIRGRKALKERLKSNLEDHRSSSVPLPHILSAAAVLLIIAGVGIYNDWFAAREGVQFLQTEEPLVAPPEAMHDKKEADETQPAGQPQAQQTAPPPQLRDEPGLFREHPTSPSDRIDDNTETTHEFDGRQLGVTPERDDPVASQEQQNELTDDAGGVWLYGNTYRPEVVSGAEMEAQQAKRAPTTAAMREKAVGEERSRQNDRAGLHTPVILQQQPLTTVSQELQLEYARREQVPALISTSIEGLILTVFLDHPVPGEMLQSAHVEWVGDDSLVVKMQEQSIGYRIPAHVLLHQHTIQR